MCKFGVGIPQNFQEAKILNEENGNTLWFNATKLELQQLEDCNTHQSVGKNVHIPPGCEQTPVKMAFDVMPSLKRKAMLAAQGDKTAPPCDAVHSGVASLQSLQIVCFLAEINGLQVTGSDVGNVHLQAFMKEKVCFQAGEEFGKLEGHLLIVVQALHGLRAGGAQFHANFADPLHSLELTPALC